MISIKKKLQGVCEQPCWPELTIEANEESFVVVLQHGGNDVTCKRSKCKLVSKCIVNISYCLVRSVTRKGWNWSTLVHWVNEMCV